jgi:Ca2+-binding RTX toxin-like protein
MTLRYFNSVLTGSGTQIDLGDTDSAIIGKDAIIGNTLEGAFFYNTIVSSGSTQTVNVQGTVYASGVAIVLGNDASDDKEQTLVVGKTGYVGNEFTSAVEVQGVSGAITNHGTIESNTSGVAMVANGDGTTTSTLTNSGELIGRTGFGIRLIGDDAYVVTNTGLISGGLDAFEGNQASNGITLVNKGEMHGAVTLGTAKDIYDGRGGTQDGGVIAAGAGNDVLKGGRGAEQLEGDAGADVISGGGGADHFVFVLAADSTVAKSGRDLIKDFSHAQHDRIDLSVIDAKAGGPPADAFSFIGTHKFDGSAGELRFQPHAGHTLIQADTDGDRHADFEIDLQNQVTLTKGDFLL